MTGEHLAEPELDIRIVPPRDRHPLILSTWDALQPGEGFLLISDHDPQPLFYQFQATRPGEFSWDYGESGPEVWSVRLGRTEPGAADTSTPPFEDSEEGSTVEFVEIEARPR